MLSSMSSFENIQTINLDYVRRHFQSKGYQFFKHKNKQLEFGLSTSSFDIEKNGLIIMVFVMKLGVNSFVCAGYHLGKFVSEREFKYESQLPEVSEQIYLNSKPNRVEDVNKFDRQLQNLRKAATKIQKNFKDYTAFSQQIKISPQYTEIMNAQKKIYQKIVKDCQKAIQDKQVLNIKNVEGMELVLRIQQNKQSLQNALLAFEDQRQSLSQIRSRFEDFISIKKKSTDDLNIYTLSQATFEEYIGDLVQLKALQLQKKCLGF